MSIDAPTLDISSPAKARVVDFETSGFPEEENAEIVEIGSVDLRFDTLEIGRFFSTLIKPAHPITPKTQAIHHISNDDVADAPPLGHQIGRLTAGMTEGCVYAAHNIKMERHFFAGGNLPWICTYKAAMSIWPDFESHSNQACRYELGIQLDEEKAKPPHRALPDAYVTAHILQECLKRRSVGDLIAITKAPILLKTCRLPRHRGKTFEEVAKTDGGYLRWIIGQDFDEDTVHTAKYWLRMTK